VAPALLRIDPAAQNKERKGEIKREGGREGERDSQYDSNSRKTLRSVSRLKDSGCVLTEVSHWKSWNTGNIYPRREQARKTEKEKDN